MKKLYTLIFIAVLTVTAFKASAQNSSNGGFDQLIKSSPTDVMKLMDAYAEPLFKGFGVGLNSGWNNTAATKSFLHFDLRITANYAMVPTVDKTFDVTKIGLSSHLTPDASSPTNIAQSFGGDKGAANPILRINDDNGAKIGSFTMPKAILSGIPAPNIQLTVGLLRNTDLTVRATPTIDLGTDAGKVNMIGFGIKHDLIQDFVGKGLFKPFDLAIAFNYNHLGYTNNLNITPSGTPAPGQPTNADFSNQQINAGFNAINIQAIISKKLLFFTPFASVGYQSSKTNFAVNGNYPVQSTAAGQGNNYVVISNPVTINETSVSGMRGDVGFQLNLAVFRLYAAYSVSGGGYNSVNGGIGFGF